MAGYNQYKRSREPSEAIVRNGEARNRQRRPRLGACDHLRPNEEVPPDLGKDQKRAVRKRAGTLVAENGEVFVVKQKRRVKVVQSVEEQKRILRACHADPTSGHFGMTKTWRRVAERFHWKGLANDVRTLVSLNSGSRVNLVRCMLGVRIVYVAS